MGHAGVGEVYLDRGMRVSEINIAPEIAVSVVGRFGLIQPKCGLVPF